MKYIKYNKDYGEKSFKVLPVLIKIGLEELRTAREMVNSDELDEFEIREVKWDIHRIIGFIHTPVKTMLFFDQKFLDEEEYILYEWACSISTEIIPVIRENWQMEQEELRTR